MVGGFRGGCSASLVGSCAGNQSWYRDYTVAGPDLPVLPNDLDDDEHRQENNNPMREAIVVARVSPQTVVVVSAEMVVADRLVIPLGANPALLSLFPIKTRS